MIFLRYFCYKPKEKRHEKDFMAQSETLGDCVKILIFAS